MKKIFITLIILMMMVLAFPLSASAITFGDMDEVYTAGEVVVINIKDDETINPKDYTINITKPNGDLVTIVPRQAKRNAANECFETYTIEMIGDYTVTVNAKDGDSAVTTFSAKLFTQNSIIFMIIAVIVFVVTLTIALKQMKNEKKKGARA